MGAIKNLKSLTKNKFLMSWIIHCCHHSITSMLRFDGPSKELQPKRARHDPYGEGKIWLETYLPKSRLQFEIVSLQEETILDPYKKHL